LGRGQRRASLGLAKGERVEIAAEDMEQFAI
jgi:hypothetical protein